MDKTKNKNETIADPILQTGLAESANANKKPQDICLNHEDLGTDKKPEDFGLNHEDLCQILDMHRSYCSNILKDEWHRGGKKEEQEEP